MVPAEPKAYGLRQDMATLSEAQLKQLYEQAMKLQAAKRYEEALARYEKMIEANPRIPEVHFQVARIFTEAGKPARALPHLQAAAALRPGEPAIWRLWAAAVALTAEPDHEANFLAALGKSTLPPEVKLRLQDRFTPGYKYVPPVPAEVRAEVRKVMPLMSVGRFAEAELLAILISSGNSKESAVELSRRILLSVNNDLSELSKKDASFLLKFNGIGEAKAVNIMAALELGRRRKEAAASAKTIITGSGDAANYFRPLLEDLPHEEFWVMLLNRSNTVIDKFMVSQGGVTGTVIDVKIILKTALEKLACALILCHNHPSGNTIASDADKKITKKIKEAAALMEISVLDHVIIAHDRYLSFADEGIL